MHADDANLDLPTCTTVIYSEQGAHAAANILTVIHMPSGSQENVIRKYYNIIFSSNVSRRRCSVSSSLSTPLVQREGTPMLELAFYAYTITIRYTSSSCGYRDLVIASTFRVFFFFILSLSLLLSSLFNSSLDTFSDCFEWRRGHVSRTTDNLFRSRGSLLSISRNKRHG